MDALREDFFGLRAPCVTADGGMRHRVYLDSAATTLAMKSAWRQREALLEQYGSVHTDSPSASGACARALREAQARILAFFGFPESDYYCLFVGSGATAALNRAARLFGRLRPNSDAVAVSLMEHHSNDLPHRAPSRPVLRPEPDAWTGRIEPEALAEVLAARRVAYVALTACSNVTGQVNPVARLAALARAHGALVLVDGAQSAVHHRLEAVEDIDAFVFAGHKAYAPGAPGVLIIRKSLHDRAGPGELGGGMVGAVGRDFFNLADDRADRLHAGTPDVLGAHQIAAALDALAAQGFAQVVAHERLLLDRLRDGLRQLGSDVTVYGAGSGERAGVVSFNLGGLPHDAVARALDRHFAISVRNGCFCAQPFVRHLLGVGEETVTGAGSTPGLVRASLAAYSRAADVDTLLSALEMIREEPGRYGCRSSESG